MKKLLNLICAILLGSIVCSSFVSCSKTGDELIPEWCCWVFLKMIPSEEEILLAKSGPSGYEGYAILDDFKEQYGKDNVILATSVPYSMGADGVITPLYGPGITPDCYEVTLTIEFPGVSLAPDDIYIFRPVKTSGNVAICKYYGWAVNEEDSEYIIPRITSWYRNARYDDGLGGTIINTTIKKLGQEVRNLPIEF